MRVVNSPTAPRHGGAAIGQKTSPGNFQRRNCVSCYVNAAYSMAWSLGSTRSEERGVAEDRLNDLHLVQRCVAGEAKAWEQILALHSRRIYNLCYRFTGREQEAEDLTQEVFLRLYRTLASYRAESGALGTWIASVTRNLLIDHYRRGKQDRQTESIEQEDSAWEPAESNNRQPDQAVYRQELRRVVEHGLSRLSPELREAVILRDLQDMDYKEIAALLKVPEGTVKSRINRGRIELARLLKPRLARRASGDGANTRGEA